MIWREQDLPTQSLGLRSFSFRQLFHSLRHQLPTALPRESTLTYSDCVSQYLFTQYLPRLHYQMDLSPSLFQPDIPIKCLLGPTRSTRDRSRPSVEVPKVITDCCAALVASGTASTNRPHLRPLIYGRSALGGSS